MKKIVLTMAAMMTMTMAMAQESDNKSERRAFKQPTPEEMTDRMAKELNLTDEQKAKVLDLNKEYQDVVGRPGMRGQRPPRFDGMRRPEGRPEKAPEGKFEAKPEAKSEAKDAKAKPDAESGATQQRPDRPQMTEAQREGMKQHMAKRQEYNAKLKEILTEDQYNTLQKMQRRPGPGRGPQGMRPERQ